MDDSDLAIEQALQRLDSESSDSEVANSTCLNGEMEPSSELDSCSVVSSELGMNGSMYSNDQAMAIIRRYVMNGNNRKMNSAAATEDNSSVASFSTE